MKHIIVIKYILAMLLYQNNAQIYTWMNKHNSPNREKLRDLLLRYRKLRLNMCHIYEYFYLNSFENSIYEKVVTYKVLTSFSRTNGASQVRNS